SMIVPPTRAAIGITCASTCASSVVSRPAVAQSHADAANTASTTTPIPMRILLFIRSLLRPSSRSYPQNSLYRSLGVAQRACENPLRDVDPEVCVVFSPVRFSDRLLCLNAFGVVADARRKTIARLRQLLVCQVAPTSRRLQQLVIRFQIEKRGL